MSNTVSIRYRSPLAGGFNSNGQPVQGKQEVRGRITVTSAAMGESLTPSDVGLATIDDLSLTVTEAAAGATGGGPRVAVYSAAAQEFYILENNDALLTKGKNFVVSFNAFGDSAANVEHL